ncbi:hypothetical protein TD95_003186 [Thielaviopsis punctulata]|uniref:GCR1-dependent translation factor 1 n=1 Tax=Thielaviopsis punctulata TaxID=72032 RepID=A0A0F4ZD19_9PEZI|nr:hypothetical protein TD95_003186 [Thielaviopsis punctulata]
MRLPIRESGVLLLLLPSLAVGAAVSDSSAAVAGTAADPKVAAAVIDTKSIVDTSKSVVSGSSKELVAPVVGGAAVVTTTTSSVSSAKATADSKAAVGAATSRADDKGPIDGKDGKPHNGPWVETTDSKKEKESGGKKTSDTSASTTVIDGKKIPESNDGVMDDKNREAPKTGTTGNDGGVSEKDKARKQEEGKTGEKAKGTPESPKAAPTLPHSEEEKILKDAGVPEDLPEKIHDKPNPVPNSAHKDHLDVSKTKTGTSTGIMAEEDGGSFHSLVLSFTMIMFAEIGDKTFLVAALMAMKHDRIVVFSAAFSALLVMTVLSAVLGHTLPVLLPKKLTAFLAAILFFVFGAKLLREGMAMSQDEGVAEEMHEVERELAEKEQDGSLASLEMGLGGDRKARFHRSPSSSPSRNGHSHGHKASVSGLGNLLGLLLSPAWVQTFVMTFLGEWGDRSQIATIAMAAGPDYWYVTIGALAGHCLCTAIAVIGGRAIAGKVSMKVVTMGGAVTFLLFGIVYMYEAMSA